MDRRDRVIRAISSELGNVKIEYPENYAYGDMGGTLVNRLTDAVIAAYETEEPEVPEVPAIVEEMAEALFDELMRQSNNSGALFANRSASSQQSYINQARAALRVVVQTIVACRTLTYLETAHVLNMTQDELDELMSEVTHE